MPYPNNTNKVSLIIMMGESNSGGLARNNQAVVTELGIRSEVKILNNYNLTFEDLNISATGNNILEHLGPNGIPDVTAPVWAGNPPHGWELGLANAVRDGKHSKNFVYLIKAGHGGSKLGDDRVVNDWIAGSRYFTKFQERYEAATTEIANNGYEPQAYVWYEIGINDCINGVDPTVWKQNFITKITAVRDFTRTDIPFFITLLPDVAKTSDPTGVISRFNLQIKDLCQETKNCYWVKSDDCHLRENDIYHWDYYGMKLLADRMSYLTAEIFGEENGYSASLETQPGQPNYDNYSPIFAVTPYASTLDPVLETVYPVFSILGRLSGNPNFDEPGVASNPTAPNYVGEPEDAITFFNSKGIPATRRVIFQQNIGSATFDRYVGNSYTDGYQLEDSCRNNSNEIVYIDTQDPRETANPGYSGSLPFVSPWTEFANNRLNLWHRNWVSKYKNLNGQIYGFISDNESASPLANRDPQGFENPIPKRYDNNIPSAETHFQTILNDPRAYSILENAGYASELQKSLRDQLDLNRYATVDFTTLETRTISDPAYNGGYFHWDYVMNSLAMWYADKYWYDVISTHYPEHTSAHIYSYYIPKEDHYIDREGLIGYGNQLVGKTCNILFFGFIGGVSSNSEIDPSDNTRTRLLSQYNPSGTPIGNRAWISLLMHQQLTKCIKRHPENEKFIPWIGSRNIGMEYAFGGLNDPNHNSLWAESVYHIALHNPNAIYFFYPRDSQGSSWSQEINLQSLYALNNILKEVNSKTGNKIISNISSTIQRLEFNTKVLITGCKTIKNKHLWRVTADVVNVNTVVLNGSNYSVNSNNPGFWYETEMNVSEIFVSGYNSTTKTLILSTTQTVVPHAKTEPGSLYKFAPDCYAPILLNDGTADHVYINRFRQTLQIYKKDQERKYKINKLTTLTASCVVQDASGIVDSNFENGIFKPKYFYLNIDNHILNKINALNVTFRFANRNYGSVNSSEPLTQETFQRVISYIKLIRKLIYHTKQVLGSQVKVYFNDSVLIPANQEWASDWYKLWDYNPSYLNSTNFKCPNCQELLGTPDIDYSDPSIDVASKMNRIVAAMEELRTRTLTWYNAIIKMLTFIDNTQRDELDLTQELQNIFPQISPNNFIITGLNYYPNSVSNIISYNTYQLNSVVNNRYETPLITEDKLKSETRKNRKIVDNLKTLRNSYNITTGAVTNNTVQQYCGLDGWLGFYESYNTFDPESGGYIKNWSNLTWSGTEIPQFNTSNAEGNRRSLRTTNPQNLNRRSFLRDYPRIILTNDEIYKYNLILSKNSGSSILMSSNTGLINVDANIGSRPLTAKPGFYNQLRACIEGEDPSRDSCRDIREQPYIKPYVIDDNFKLRLNAYNTFNCEGNTPEECVDYCYLNMEPGEGDNAAYSVLQGLVTRKWLYDLAVEYASYDDGVAIPYKDYSNENYWFGYYGRNAQFDPFVTVAESQRMDDTLWPHYQRSETGKRMDALAIILSARKEASLWNFYKNTTTTQIKDWPQPSAKFEVDRKPGTIVLSAVSGGYENRRLLGWSDAKYWKKNTGIASFIDEQLTWNYVRRGIRRFILWSPSGVLPTPDGVDWSYTSAITSSMNKRVYDVYDKNGNIVDRIINPCEACWEGNGFSANSDGLEIPPSIQIAESEDTIFTENARLIEWQNNLSSWLAARNDAVVGICMGYALPTTDGILNSDITIYGEVTTGQKGFNSTEGKGWQIPNPGNNPEHESFLTNELQPWIDMGIKFFAFDKGEGLFNYDNGGLLTSNIEASPVSEYKQWIAQTWPENNIFVMTATLPIDVNAPIVNEFNQQVTTTSYPRKTIYTKNPNIEVCKGELVKLDQNNTYNSVYRSINCWKNEGRERYRKLNPQGMQYESNGRIVLKYSAGAYQYIPYIIDVTTELNSGEWNIGLHNETTLSSFAGLDPNEMLCWYRKNTEIGAFFNDFYKLSPTLLAAYRAVFNEKIDLYANLWKFTPAWHDLGLQNPTPIPTGIPAWDGRNYPRDGAYYNKIRNEIFVKVKNYIDRGYVFWSNVSKNHVQLIKDVHRDCLNYTRGYETNTELYEEDVAPPEPSTQIPPKEILIPPQTKLSLNKYTEQIENVIRETF